MKKLLCNGALRLVQPFLWLLITLIGWTNALAQPDLSLDDDVHTIGYSGTYADYKIPANVGTYLRIRLTVNGGDGGKRVVTGLCTTKAGGGATAELVFNIGTGQNELQPGGTLRFIAGGKGANKTSNGIEGAGGGGGSAVLYKAPNAIITCSLPSEDINDASSCWVILAAAGGGGGAYSSGVCGGQQGGSGNSGTSGDDGFGLGGGIGGSNGHGGAGGGTNQSPASGGGGGAYSDGGGYEGSPGGAGGFIGGAAGTRDQDGGYGFGGGGSASSGGGGGGGYSGAGGGDNFSAGGGGGSFGNSAAESTNIQGGNVTSNPASGQIDYQFIQTDPVALCKDIDIYLNSNGEAATPTYAELDNGSYDFQGGPLEYLVLGYVGTFNCNFIGDEIYYTMYIADQDNNFNSCNSKVTIVDDIDPTMINPGTQTYNRCNGSNIVLPSGNPADACGLAGTYYAVQEANSNGVGIGNWSDFEPYTNGAFTATADYYNVQIMAVDNHDNTKIITYFIKVLDQIAPTAKCRTANVILNASGQGTLSANSVDNTSTDFCSTIASRSVSPSAFTCSNIGANSVTLTVSDTYGNTNSCTTTVTVVDNLAPSVTCKNATVILNASGLGSITTASVYQSGSDNCGVVNQQSVSPSIFTCSNLGTNMVMLTVNDSHGNTNNCIATVTVSDFIAPSVMCKNATVSLDDSGSGSITMASVYQSGSDNCGIVNQQSVSPSSFTCSDIGTNTVTLTVNDSHGNTNTCTAVVTVQDIIPPSISCKPFTLSLNTLGVGSISTGDVFLSGSDNCGTVGQLSVTPSTFYCANLGTNTVTLSANDGHGNTNTCTATVTVIDAIAPTVICKAATVNLNSLGVGSISTSDVYQSGADNCSVVNLQGVTPNTFNCGNIGTNTVVLTVNDGHGNTSSCTASITVQDIIKPTVVCMPATIVLDAAGNAAITTASIFQSGDDNCGTVNQQSVSPNAFTCANWGTNTVVLTVNDSHGNTDTCTATVTVSDNLAPSVVCKNATVSLDASGSGSITTASVYQSGSDNCGIVNQQSVSPSSFTCSNLGTNTVTLTVNDGHGNTNTCTATVTVSDNLAPSVVCKNATVSLDASGSGSITTASVYQSGSDNCGVVNQQSVSPSSFTCSNLGTNTVTLTVNDSHGNTNTCTATVTVSDNLAPSVVCKNASVSLDASGSGSITTDSVYQSASDNCGVVNQQSVSPSSFTCSNLGTNTVTLTVNDGHGNTGTCSATVTVSDNLTPSLVCKNATVNLDASGSGSITTASVYQSGSDNCGVVNQQSVSPSSFTCSNLGTNTVTLTVNDGHGNTNTCTATVTVSDNLAPSVVCKNATVSLDASGSGSITTASVYQSGSDNCGVVNQQSVSPSSFTCSNLGANTVTLIVNDGHGNTGTCSATVTVTDNISPTLFCKNATIYLNASGQATLTVAQVNNGSYDNCSITVLVLGQTTFTCANIGNNYVTLRGIDQSNNRGQCIATVTVIDPIAPTARCKNVAANLGANGSVTVPATSVDNGSTDNCSYTLTLSPNTFTCGNIGLNTVTLKATDAGGNAATCTAKVTIRDLATPKALCKNVTIYLDDNGQGSITASQLDNNSTDNCGITTRTININTFNCSNIDSPQPVTLTLRDGSNNQSTCQAMVTVKDNLAPTAVCENTTVQLNSQGQAVVYTSNLTDGSFDNCSVYATTPSAKVYTSANIGINYLTLTVKDWSGNGSTCVAQITVTPQGMAGGGGLASKTDLEPNDEAATDRVITAPTADFRIFPNPSPGKAVVEMFFEDELDFSLRVFDALGRLISDQKVKSQVGENRVELDLKNLPSGWYQVQIESAYFRKSKGLVIERL